MSKQVQFAGYKCSVDYGSYSNGRVAIRLLSVPDGAPVATATCNIPDVEIPDNTAFIKDYSENTGILKVLHEAGIIKPTEFKVRQGFVDVPLCEVIDKSI